MNSIKSRVEAFLINHNIHYRNIDITDCCKTFIDDMGKGLAASKSSLKMIPTYISVDEDIPVDKPVIVMDAGGTNFRVALVCFDKNRHPSIEYAKTYSMPGSKGEISKQEFFDTITQYLAPVIDKSSSIGFCFSYPTQILPSKDGKLMGFNKEIRVRNMKGVQIGENLIDALQKKGVNNKKRVVMLNDTVAALLAGKYAYPNRRFESYIGFILGTGTNTCYIEQNKNIKKVPMLAKKQGCSIINIESGGFDQALRGDMDKAFDNNTNNPGDHQFEKMIAGAYQGGLILEVLKKACEEGLLSKQFEKRLQPELTTKDVNDFLYYPYSSNALAQCAGSDEDRMVVYYIVDAVLERAAKLVAANLSAIIEKTNKGKNPCMPICIAAEGSTFYKHKILRSKLEYYVKEYLNNQAGVYCEFVRSENATLIGAAIAGLLA